MRRYVGLLAGLLMVALLLGVAQAEEYGIGQTWTVEGQWSLTIDAVEETDERNQFWGQTPAAVYAVSYTYSNLGYVDSWGVMDGLVITVTDTAVDSAGMVAYDYPLGALTSPQETPVGATCKAQGFVGVDNPGLPIKLYVSVYDSHNDKQSAVFVLDDMPMNNAPADVGGAVDYEDAASFEAALNAGTNLTGKTVRFKVDAVVPDSMFGYNLQAGEHLNFCSANSPGISVGDTVTVKIVEVSSMMGSYIIGYEKVD